MIYENQSILTEYSPDPLLLIDRENYMIAGCNSAAALLYGYTENDLLTRSLSSLLDDKSQLAVFKNARSESGRMLITQTHIQKKGLRAEVEINCQYLEIEQKSYLILAVRDITQRHSYKLELEKQNLLQKAMLTISESSRKSELDQLFRIIHEQIQKLMPAQNFFIALLEDYDTCRYRFPYYQDLIGKDGIEENGVLELPGSFTDWVTKNESLLLDQYSVNKIVAGEIDIDIDVDNIGERSQSWMGVQLKGRDGLELGVIVVQDYENPDAYSDADFNLLKMASETIGSAIEYNRTQLELEKNEKMFRTLVETAAVGLNEIDMQENILYTNKIFARLLGYENESQIIGKNLKAFTSPDVYQTMVEKTKTERAMGKAGIYETQLIAKDGNVIDVIMNSTPVTNDKGEVTKCIAVVTNITEQKQAHRARIIAQKHAADQEKHALVGQVAGKMAHDFNNILGAIMGNAEISLIDCEDEEIRHTLQIILEQTLRGRNLTKNLVAFAKDQEPRQEFFSINNKIDLALNLLKKDLESIQVVTDLAHDIPELLADPGMIEHTLINLIQNAIHATSRVNDAYIKIKTSHAKATIEIEIEDNGCGIPEKHKDSIFTPAFTLKGSNDVLNAYRSNIKGTGYGMSNVKMYIEKHHGRITFSSRENEGTKFTIALPIKMNGLTDDEIVEVKEGYFETEKKILIVEDETTISTIQARVLKQSPFNHRVDIAENGTMALEYFNQNQYDLITLDYVLPGNLTGMDIYHKIRLETQDMPILFISGNLEFIESIKELQKNDPRIDHLSKPSTNKDFVKCVNELLIRGQV
jgi:PAS domain S-box-containing protein